MIDNYGPPARDILAVLRKYETPVGMVDIIFNHVKELIRGETLITNHDVILYEQWIKEKQQEIKARHYSEQNQGQVLEEL